MPSPVSIGLGVGITLGVLVVLAIIIITVGLCTSGSRTRDFDRERARRVERVRESHQREQDQWRERRLRDVVILLIERGEAQEGVPLAFQIANRPEVPARRALRNRRGRTTQRQELEIELANEDENSRLDPQAQEIARKPLTELLANGRPEEAEAGPDVMQLLLDGQEVQHHTSSDDDDDYFLEEDTDPSVTPSFSQQGAEGDNRSGWRMNGAYSQPPSAPPTPPLRSQPTPQTVPPVDSQHSPSPDAAEIEARTTAVLAAEQQRRDAREAALMEELRREKRRRRRKTADEVYGEAADYAHNPANDLIGKSEEEEEAPQSPLWRFLSPLTPFRGNRSKSKRSAFADRVPDGSGAMQDGPGSPGSPRKAAQSPGSPWKVKSSGRSPF